MAVERTVSWWKDSIRNGQRFQLDHGNARNWRQYKEYYRHNFAKGILPVNQVFSIMRSVVAQTYFKNPSVTITPQRPGMIYQLHAMLLEKIDRWLLRELLVKDEIKQMIQDTFLTGLASGFNGYDSEYGFDPKHTEQNNMASLTQFDKKGYRIEYNANVNPGMPWFIRARPEDVVYPWGTSNKHNAEWVAMRVFRPLNDLKKDPKYRVPANLAGSHVPYRTGPEGETYYENTWNRVQQIREIVELWQIHDAKTGKILAITMQGDTFLRNDIDYNQIDGLPVETLCFNPDPDYIYGVPDAKIIEPQLIELNEIRTQAMKHRRIDILKILYKKGAIKGDTVNKLLDEDVKAAVEVDADEALRDVVLPIPGGATGVLQDMAFAAEQARQDIRETVGFSRVAQGDYQGKTHIAAAETNQVMARGDIRIDERKDAIADLLTNIVRKFNQTIFTHWTIPVIRDLIGPDGVKYWLKFTGPEIKADYNIKIDPYSAGSLSPDQKKQDAIMMGKIWAETNKGAMKNGATPPAELQRYFYSQFEGINVEAMLSQQGMTPQAQQQNPMSVPEAAAQIQEGMQG